MVRSSIANIEHGHQKVQLHTIYALADAMSVPVTQLLPADIPLDSSIDVLLKDQLFLSEDGEEELLDEEERNLILALGEGG